MFSTKLITDYCKNIRKDINTLGKVLNYAEKLKNSKSIKDKHAQKQLYDYNSIEKVANGHSYVSPFAKKIKNYLSKFHDGDMKSIDGIQKTATKLCDIKEIYKAKNIKGTGLSELKKICKNSSFLKDDIEFKCSKSIVALPIEVDIFLKSVKETNTKIKNLPPSSNKDPIKNEIEIVNKYYTSLKLEKQKFIKNFSNIKESCQTLKEKIVSEVGKLSEKKKNVIEISNRTSSEVTEQDEQNYEKEITNLSKIFLNVVTTLEKSKIGEHTFSYFKEFREIEKNTLAKEDNSVGISPSEAKKRISNLDKRWNIFNNAVIEGNYNDGDKSAWSIMKKNSEKIKQINQSLKLNNENEIKIEEIEKEVDAYIKDMSAEKLDFVEFLKSTTPQNFQEQINRIKSFQNEKPLITNFKAKIESFEQNKKDPTYTALFTLFTIRNMYIEILEYLVKVNEFLEKSSKEIDLCLEKFGEKKKGKIGKKIDEILHGKVATGFTKFSAIGCFAGVAISNFYPPVGIAIIGVSLVATIVQAIQAWTS